MFEKLGAKYGSAAGVVCLITASLLWGAEFAIAKDVLAQITPNWINAIRMFFTSLAAVVLWRKQFKQASLQDWKRGAVCGVLFGLGFALQVMGLDMVNTGINAFLSSAYVILVPFMSWFILKIRPKCKVFIGAAVGITGIITMSVTGFSGEGLSIGLGETLSLLSALGYGSAMVALDICTEKTNSEFLTGAQFIFSFIVAIIFAVVLEPVPSPAINTTIIIEFIYLIVLGTFATQILFTFGIKYASANHAGIIFPLESVSATILGCLWLGETLETVHIIGAVLIIAAIIISSVEFNRKTELT